MTVPVGDCGGGGGGGGGGVRKNGGSSVKKGFQLRGFWVQFPVKSCAEFCTQET
jgi:hypothetical protein